MSSEEEEEEEDSVEEEDDSEDDSVDEEEEDEGNAGNAAGKQLDAVARGQESHAPRSHASKEGLAPLHTPEELQLRKQNVKALLSDSLQLQRAPTSRYLSVQQSEAVLRQQFVSPKPGTGPGMSDELRKRLLARKFFVPWGQKKPFTTPLMLTQTPSTSAAPAPVPPPEQLPEGVEPLVLWTPPPPDAEGQPEGEQGGIPKGAVVVDPMLVKWLRPHQREGVAFMFECVAGLRLPEGQGCILADDMGLGKTLQGLTLLWTLVTDGHALLGGKPLAKRTLIVCPTSLVSNWDSEATKWLKGRLSTLALSEASREDVMASITRFLQPSNPYKVLIISYETLRLHAARLQQPGACDLLICDEAHRLKNDATLTNKALSALPCKRRVLLSGTPMQNHLDEFYAMVDFCNPGILGGPAEFRRRFEGPILAGREPGASPEEVARGEARSGELSELINTFILRRTNTLLSAHLPPKVVEVVCCQLTPLQTALYNHFLASKAARKILGGKTGSSGVLPAISNLKKLCNHPKLIYDAVHSKVPNDAAGAKGSKKGSSVAGFENVAALFPPLLFDDGRPGRGGMAKGWELTSGKFAVAARMLHLLATETEERIVIVSNYTQTLDLFAMLCRERNYPLLRLDGSTSISKREKLVTAFNDLSQRQFVFLLSSKAGGCGLNLVGANRLILYDVDWNPAVDKQAAARVWRDGQKRRVYVYRFLATGTIEEKVFQRQISKEGLQALVAAKGSGKGAGGAGKNMMSTEELRELFQLHPGTLSHTYEVVQRKSLGGKQGKKGKRGKREKAEGGSSEEDEGKSDDSGTDGGSHSEAEEAEGSDEESGSEDGRDTEMQEKRDAGGAGGSVEGGEGAPALQKQYVYREQIGNPNEDELKNWGHHSDPRTVPDVVMQRVAERDVSFVFSCQVAGKDVQDTVFRPKQAAAGSGMGVGLGTSGSSSSCSRALRGAAAGGGAATAAAAAAAATGAGGGIGQVAAHRPSADVLNRPQQLQQQRSALLQARQQQQPVQPKQLQQQEQQQHGQEDCHPAIPRQTKPRSAHVAPLRDHNPPSLLSSRVDPQPGLGSSTPRTKPVCRPPPAALPTPAAPGVEASGPPRKKQAVPKAPGLSRPSSTVVYIDDDDE